MANPSPVQTKEFLARKIKPIGDMPDEPLGEKPLAVRVGTSVYEAVSKLPQRDRINWMRKVLTEAAQRELMEGDAS